MRLLYIILQPKCVILQLFVSNTILREFSPPHIILHLLPSLISIVCTLSSQFVIINCLFLQVPLYSIHHRFYLNVLLVSSSPLSGFAIETAAFGSSAAVSFLASRDHFILCAFTKITELLLHPRNSCQCSGILIYTYPDYYAYFN